MLSLDGLKAYGGNVEEGLSRCMNDEAFYLRMVQMMLSDHSMDKLEAAIHEGNLDAAFEAAHALKGVAGNLSLTPLYEADLELTECLRARKDMDYEPLLSKVKAAYDELKKLAE